MLATRGERPPFQRQAPVPVVCSALLPVGLGIIDKLFPQDGSFANIQAIYL